MIFHVLTVFPDLVRTVFDYGVVRRGAEAGLLGHEIRDLREFTTDKHRSTDDQPFGGGPGMVMLADPIFKGVEAIRSEHGQDLPLILTSPAGEQLDHKMACDLAQGGNFILLCGRYEGLDQRVIDHLVDREISVGEYVLSGGELAAMTIIDAVSRQIPGVIGNAESCQTESYASGILDWPHYTRPEVYRGIPVPEVLLSGNHAKIHGFREDAALLLTYRRRPELLSGAQLERIKQITADGRQEDTSDAGTD